MANKRKAAGAGRLSIVVVGVSLGEATSINARGRNWFPSMLYAAFSTVLAVPVVGDFDEVAGFHAVHASKQSTMRWRTASRAHRSDFLS